MLELGQNMSQMQIFIETFLILIILFSSSIFPYKLKIIPPPPKLYNQFPAMSVTKHIAQRLRTSGLWSNFMQFNV